MYACISIGSHHEINLFVISRAKVNLETTKGKREGTLSVNFLFYFFQFLRYFSFRSLNYIIAVQLLYWRSAIVWSPKADANASYDQLFNFNKVG